MYKKIDRAKSIVWINSNYIFFRCSNVTRHKMYDALLYLLVLVIITITYHNYIFLWKYIWNHISICLLFSLTDFYLHFYWIPRTSMCVLYSYGCIFLNFISIHIHLLLSGPFSQYWPKSPSALESKKKKEQAINAMEKKTYNFLHVSTTITSYNSTKKEKKHHLKNLLQISYRIQKLINNDEVHSFVK